eukprot:CAMPEP_0182945002 /NCGR_PEP_ID=MMETSP0105_2-20130417/54876_1 /TAXON_ID=81532 ORGANISM="Acanthoeca-like sp., Strain 10tr" /NCGR_SAMPLE_ID=MMETSP0105_2 /ASSEMBLY_ACC=CAM_ASM_000205 /LENGTH=73 /DNA_ID=CAMNT_0025084985 /DNA_START=9 /DNA_END=227 /DNA_ORIENTATION=+
MTNANMYRQLGTVRRASVDETGPEPPDGGDEECAPDVLEAGPFDILPDELLLGILTRFPTPELLRVARACRRF